MIKNFEDYSEEYGYWYMPNRMVYFSGKSAFGWLLGWSLRILKFIGNSFIGFVYRTIQKCRISKVCNEHRLFIGHTCYSGDSKFNPWKR
jgi:hypothetical protein